MKNLMSVGIIAVVTLGLISGCNSQKEANDQNISDAVARYLDSEQGALCLQLHQWPVLVEPDELHMIERFPKGLAGQMQVLQQVGLASSTDVELVGFDFLGKKNIGKRYQLTAMGQKFYREKSTDQSQPYDADLCFVQRKLDHLISWEPIKSGIGQTVNATYTYQVTDIPDWAKKPEFKSVFSDETSLAFAPVQEQRTVTLTDSGWHVQTAPSSQ